MDCFTDLFNAVRDGSAIIPTDLLIFSAFTRYWHMEYATMKVVKKSSDFCDLCTKMKNAIAALHSNDERHSCLTTLLQDHIENARKEREHYGTNL